MSYTERAIKIEAGYFVVVRFHGRYEVLAHTKGRVAAVVDSAYAETDDGMSIATARARYLDRRYPDGYPFEAFNRIAHVRLA